MLLCQSRRTQRQRDQVGLRDRSARRGMLEIPIIALVHDTMHALTAANQLGLPRKVGPRNAWHICCTGRWVLEQETGEQLDRFRRPCAALYALTTNLGIIRNCRRAEAFEGAADDRYCGRCYAGAGVPISGSARFRRPLCQLAD